MIDLGNSLIAHMCLNIPKDSEQVQKSSERLHSQKPEGETQMSAKGGTNMARHAFCIIPPYKELRALCTHSRA